MDSFAQWTIGTIARVSFSRTRCTLRALTALVALLLACFAPLAPSFGADNEAALRDKYQSLSAQLASNPFHRPLYLDSTEAHDSLKGDIYAVLDYPFATVNGA